MTPAGTSSGSQARASGPPAANGNPSGSATVCTCSYQKSSMGCGWFWLLPCFETYAWLNEERNCEHSPLVVCTISRQLCWQLSAKAIVQSSSRTEFKLIVSHKATWPISKSRASSSGNYVRSAMTGMRDAELQCMPKLLHGMASQDTDAMQEGMLCCSHSSRLQFAPRMISAEARLLTLGTRRNTLQSAQPCSDAQHVRPSSKMPAQNPN